MEKQKMKTIYNLRLAGYLMTKGFVLFGQDKNTDNSNRFVYFFNDSPQLDAAINEYLSTKRKVN